MSKEDLRWNLEGPQHVGQGEGGTEEEKPVKKIEEWPKKWEEI